MAKNVKVTVDRKAVTALLKSPAVQADLLARARRIASAAGPGMEASSMVGRTRARASVITATPEAMLAEAKTRRLSSSLQAGA
jgi:hypothetical protein